MEIMAARIISSMTTLSHPYNRPPNFLYHLLYSSAILPMLVLLYQHALGSRCS